MKGVKAVMGALVLLALSACDNDVYWLPSAPAYEPAKPVPCLVQCMQVEEGPFGADPRYRCELPTGRQCFVMPLEVYGLCARTDTLFEMREQTCVPR